MASNDTQGSSPVLRVIVLGDCGVGKTTLVDIFRGGLSSKILTATVGVDIFRKDVVFDGKPCILEIRDVLPKVRYQSVSSPYYRDCHACILMFAFDNKDSYENLYRWHHDILAHVHDMKFPFVVVGNKSDLIGNTPMVSTSCIREWCTRRGIDTYLETSCEDLGSITAMFEIATMKADMFRRRQNASGVIGHQNASDVIGHQNASDVIGHQNASDVIGHQNASDVIGHRTRLT